MVLKTLSDCTVKRRLKENNVKKLFHYIALSNITPLHYCVKLYLILDAALIISSSSCRITEASVVCKTLSKISYWLWRLEQCYIRELLKGAFLSCIVWLALYRGESESKEQNKDTLFICTVSSKRLP